MIEAEDLRLEEECTVLEWQLQAKKEALNFLAALVSDRQRELGSLKSFLVNGRTALTDFLAQNEGTSNLLFEQKKLELISTGESRIEEALAREVVALKSRFPERDVQLSEQWTVDTFPQALGNIVEKAIKEALALEKETIASKQALLGDIEQNERLREQVRQLEAHLVAELSDSNSAMASEN